MFFIKVIETLTNTAPQILPVSVALNSNFCLCSCLRLTEALTHSWSFRKGSGKCQAYLYILFFSNMLRNPNCFASLFVLKVCFIFNYLCVEGWLPVEARKQCETPPRTGVIDGCELSDVGAVA